VQRVDFALFFGDFSSRLFQSVDGGSQGLRRVFQLFVNPQSDIPFDTKLSVRIKVLSFLCNSVL